jgi:hypothetical protein
MTRHGLTALLCVLILSGSLPTLAAEDLSGTWSVLYMMDWLEIGTGPEIAEYEGLPLNDAARQRALAWNASLITEPERQCAQLPLDYADFWTNMRIWNQVDPVTQQVTAIRSHREWGEENRIIYMDGRSHPSTHAAHTWQGFSTGQWDGDDLIVTTTHLKEGYVRRNGVPRSDRATIMESFMRHGSNLTIGIVVNDPVYLTDLWIRSVDYVLTPEHAIRPFPCESVAEQADVPPGHVPHYFPWKNPFLREHAKKFGMPLSTSMGGANQMYPSFIE